MHIPCTKIIKSIGRDLPVMSIKDLCISENKKKAIDEFIRELKEKYGDKIKKIILFGSIVRGDTTEESDIDVLIVGDITLDEAVEVGYPMLLKYGELISPHIMDEEYYSMLKANRSGFIEAVEREGSVIA